MNISFNNINHEFTDLAHIHAQCFAKAWSESTFREMFTDSPQYSGNFIVQDSKNIGFVICSKIIDEAEIMTICILPDYRQQGFAAKLLTHQITQLRLQNIAKLYLEVNEFNPHAIQLYKKLGFTQSAMRKNYYKSADGVPENALILTLNL